MAITLNTASRNAAANAVLDQLNGGKLVIYGGTPPANAAAALSSNPVLAELTFGTPAFNPAANGTKTLANLTQDSSANANGTATFFRCLTSADVVVLQGTCGSGSGDLNLNTVSIASGVPVSVNSFDYTQAG